MSYVILYIVLYIVYTLHNILYYDILIQYNVIIV